MDVNLCDTGFHTILFGLFQTQFVLSFFGQGVFVWGLCLGGFVQGVFVLTILGKCIVSVTHKKTTTPVLSVVADIDSVPVFGLKTSAGLNLIQHAFKVSAGEPDCVSVFSDCFGELGMLPNVHHITTDPNVRPVVHPAQRIPIVLRRRPEAELTRMTEMGVINQAILAGMRRVQGGIR